VFEWKEKTGGVRRNEKGMRINRDIKLFNFGQNKDRNNGCNEGKMKSGWYVCEITGRKLRKELLLTNFLLSQHWMSLFKAHSRQNTHFFYEMKSRNSHGLS
jgi:hypothetical protein